MSRYLVIHRGSERIELCKEGQFAGQMAFLWRTDGRGRDLKLVASWTADERPVKASEIPRHPKGQGIGYPTS